MLCMATNQAEMAMARIPRWTVGDRLRKAREIAGIGSQEMADKLGRSRNSVTRYEHARTVDSLVVRAYAEFTGCSMRWLLTGIEPEGGEAVIGKVTSRYRQDGPTNNPQETLKVAA